MTGAYPIDARAMQKIEEWVHSCRNIQADGFTDVHIDQLSREYRDSNAWIPGTVACLEHAAGIETQDGVICAAVDLAGESFYCGVNYRSCTELMNEFSFIPPSLYCFGLQAIPWHNELHPFRRITIEDFPIDPRRWGLWHLEYSMEHESDFRRSLWILPALSSPDSGE